jgi:acetyltransferase-like isoleucine patch superfamily enzyme
LIGILKYITKRLCAKILELGHRFNDENTRRKFSLPDTVSIYHVSLEGNVSIGEFTYINEGSRVDSGVNSSVKIGRHCAIGRDVHITAKTHDLSQPTTDEAHKQILHKEANIWIGDYVWIGDKAIILPGVIIGDNAIVAAHAVVTHDVKKFEIVGGVPAKHIKFNTRHYRFPVVIS